MARWPKAVMGSRYRAIKGNEPNFWNEHRVFNALAKYLIRTAMPGPFSASATALNR